MMIVAGPKLDRNISKKIHQTGIWLNGPTSKLQDAPGYLAVLSTQPARQFNFNDQAGQLLALLNYLPDTTTNQQQKEPETLPQWQSAYGQLLQNQALLINRQDGSFINQTTGQLDIKLNLPSSAPTGDYQVTLLVDTEAGLSRLDARLELIKVGIVKQLEHAAFNRPTLYGVGSLAFALLFGWSIGIVFNRR